MSGFVPRLTRPEKGNKYYIRKASGGYSCAIEGKPRDPHCDVLSNCVGYAYGRFNEIGGYGACKYLKPVNAENFVQWKGSLESGMVPKLGACMVWQKGPTLSSDDGVGHVAIVEKIVSETEVVTSESNWGSKVPFQVCTRKKGADGRWGQGKDFKFLGFIYNPAVDEKEEDDMLYYETIKDVPGDYRPTIQKLMDRGVIKGTGKDGVIHKSEDFCQVMTALDRLGKLD